MVGFESLTQGVMVLAVYCMHYLLFSHNLVLFLELFVFCCLVCSWFIYSVMFIIGIRVYGRLPPLTGGLLVYSDTGRSY